MIENSAKAKANEIEKILLSGDTHAAEEQFRADYIDAINRNRPDLIEAEKGRLQEDPAGYKLIMLEVAKHFVGSNSNSENRLIDIATRGRAQNATAVERLHGEAAQMLIGDYSELTGGGRHFAKKLFSAHWGHGVVKYDIDRVEKEMRQDLGTRVFADKLADNNYELFRKISDDGKDISADDLKDVLKKDDRLGHDFLTGDQRKTVEQLAAAMNKDSDKNSSNYYLLPKSWKHISIDEVRQNVRVQDYEFLRSDNPSQSTPRLRPRTELADGQEAAANEKTRVRPREIVSSEKAINCAPGENDAADQKRLEELSRLAVARHHEGYSYIATRLLGFAQPNAGKREIERAYAGLSETDKQHVMALSAALDRANRQAHNGRLMEGDVVPLNSAEVQALLKR